MESDRVHTEVHVLADTLNFPEGPAFDPANRLWCVDIKGGSLVACSAEGVTVFPTDGAPNGLTFDARGLAWFCDSGQCAVRTFDPETRSIQTVVAEVDGQRLDKPNDLAFDRAGSLIFTCPGNSRTEPTGYVCVLRPDGFVRKVAHGMFFPNGLAFVDGGKALVIAETYRWRLWKGAWDAENCRWIGPHPWAEMGGPIGPDGMALGADGLLYVAVFGLGVIKAVDGAGKVIRSYPLPGARPTNAAFDPAGRLGLVVTEAEQGLLLSLPALGPGAPLFDGGGCWP